MQAMTLKEWAELHGAKPGYIAERISVRRQSVHRYLNGERTPLPLIQKRLADLTENAVTPMDWHKAAVNAHGG